jgi:hypothetical protein
MKPRRKTTEIAVRKARLRAAQRRYKERNRDALNAARRAQHPEWWEANKERILAERRTPEKRESARVYNIQRRRSGGIAARLMLSKARQRAKKFGVVCTITVADIFVPETCPLLGVPLFVSTDGHSLPNSPSLDRIRPELGYVAGNVWVVSHRANSIKNNATADELERIAAALRRIEKAST